MKPTKSIKILSLMNETALTLSEGEFKTNNGSLIVCGFYGGIKQRWMIRPEGETCTIASLHNHSLLDVPKGSEEQYAALACGKPKQQKSQFWKIEPFGRDDGVYYIRNANSGLVIEIEGGIDAEGMRVVQNKPLGHLNQLWKIAVA